METSACLTREALEGKKITSLDLWIPIFDEPSFHMTFLSGVAHLASDFREDGICLRRVKPSKRDLVFAASERINRRFFEGTPNFHESQR